LTSSKQGETSGDYKITPSKDNSTEYKTTPGINSKIMKQSNPSEGQNEYRLSPTENKPVGNAIENKNDNYQATPTTVMKQSNSTEAGNEYRLSPTEHKQTNIPNNNNKDDDSNPAHEYSLTSIGSKNTDIPKKEGENYIISQITTEQSKQ
jgi:hypothetical protein